METHEHLIGIKVLKLSKPTLSSFGSAINVEGFTNFAETKFLCNSDFLILPQIPNHIVYLGQNFSCFVCAFNNTTYPINKVSVKYNLQLNNSNLVAYEKTVEVLNKNETIDEIIRFEVKKLGTHVLACEVKYFSPAGMPFGFRLFFKFQAVKPLDVQTKYHNFELDEVLLEVNLQNITKNMMNLERVNFQTSEFYECKDYSIEKSFIRVLQPQSSCQFLYHFKSIIPDGKTLKPEDNVGRLEIAWRTAGSGSIPEQGRLQTCQLNRNHIDSKDLDLKVIEAESSCEVSKPYSFICRVTNTSNRTMDIIIFFNKRPHRDIPYSGSTEEQLGIIQSDNFKEFKLTIFPSKLGIISVSDLNICDDFSKRIYKFKHFLQVLVCDKDSINEDFILYHDIPLNS